MYPRHGETWCGDGGAPSTVPYSTFIMDSEARQEPCFRVIYSLIHMLSFYLPQGEAPQSLRRGRVRRVCPHGRLSQYRYYRTTRGAAASSIIIPIVVAIHQVNASI
jgi:hypothetical protein